MKRKQNSITVFIATTAEKKRKLSLERAISSVNKQHDVDVKLSIIINGDRFDRALRENLENDVNIDSHYLEEGSFPKALKYARKIVNTEYFCFLDDDDELLCDSLRIRLQEFINDNSIDAVIGNGYRNNNDTLVLDRDKQQLFFENPLMALFEKSGNWLASCSGLFKTSSIPQEYFDDYATYAEWSYLAVKLALFKRVSLVNTPCYIIHDSDSSLSKSYDYVLFQYRYLFKLMNLGLPADILKIIKKKKTEMAHELSTLSLAHGKKRLAWYYHIKSLNSFYGFRKYILSTRHLVLKLIFIES